MTVAIQEVLTEAERLQLFGFRYTIYAEELNKQLSGIDHQQKIYTDELDKNASLIVAKDTETGEIVGAIRSNPAAESLFPQQLYDCLKLQPLLQTLDQSSVSYTSGLMIDPGYRGTTVASLLVTFLYKRSVEIGYSIDICLSELTLVHPYYQLGYRPYGPPCRLYENSGLRMPMVIISQDKAYLKKVRSPFRRFPSAAEDDGGNTAQLLKKTFPDWEDPVVTPLQIKALWAGIAHSFSSSTATNFFKGFSGEEMQRLMQHMRRYPNIRIKQGKRLFTQGENERSMGLLLSGQLGITFDKDDDPHFVAVLGPGEICGEAEALIGGARSASLVALEDSEVLILPSNLFEVMGKQNASFASRLSMNLNLLLVSRLQMMHLHYMKSYQRASSRRYKKEEQRMGNGTQEAEDFNDSYAINTLDDPKRELERLQKQAWMGEEIERYWLNKIGCVDNSTFLDLGSGPGLTSIMLAKMFPNSQFIGVEPDDMLRNTAMQAAQQAGVSKRCSFINGRGEEIPLEDDRVDYCNARFVFQHLPNPSEVLAELRRVTRPGGLIFILDVDDRGVIIHPEPPGLNDFQQRTAKAQAKMGGDRHIGRKLGELMLGEGLTAINTEVVPITSREIPMHALVDAAFSFKEQTLKRMHLWKAEDQQVIDSLRNLSSVPGAWMYVPVFLAHARKKEGSS